jgi:hypothetical protein
MHCAAGSPQACGLALRLPICGSQLALTQGLLLKSSATS